MGYNTGNSRFTAPITGVYKLSFAILSASSGAYNEYDWWVNGRDTNIGCFDAIKGKGHTTCMTSSILQLNSGDYVEVRSHHRTSAIWMDTKEDRGLSHISVEYLGGLDVCQPTAFQANGNLNFKNMKVGQLIPFQTVLRNFGNAYKKNINDYNIGCYEAGNDHASCTMFAPMTLKKNDRVDIRCAVTGGGSVWADKASNADRGLTNFRGFKLFDSSDKNAVAFQAVLPKSITVKVGQVVPYTQVKLNVGGAYNAKNSRFIAPRSGVYSFGVNQLSSSGTSAVELAFAKNGKYYKIGCYDGEDSHTGCLMTTLIELCKNQYVDVRIRYHTSQLYGQKTRGLSAFYGYLTKGVQSYTSC